MNAEELFGTSVSAQINNLNTVGGILKNYAKNGSFAVAIVSQVKMMPHVVEHYGNLGINLEISELPMEGKDHPKSYKHRFSWNHVSKQSIDLDSVLEVYQEHTDSVFSLAL